MFHSHKKWALQNFILLTWFSGIASHKGIYTPKLDRYTKSPNSGKERLSWSEVQASQYTARGIGLI